MLVGLVATSCLETKVLDGVWDTERAVDFDPTIVGDALPPSVFVRLVLGHYGPDVAGTLRFYEDGTMKDEWAPCPCRYVLKGDFDEGLLSFEVRGCAPDASVDEIRGAFTIDESGELLEGTFTVDGEEAATQFVLLHGGGEKSITKELKRCPDDDPED